ncbi:hypothetical protein GCM10023186_04210 [Hymenobacter koreensis]|uniref:Secretion system C-terminal sorting domain-containing protein n=2 Tax=Hymenobacter koreensis TaxID=1084523 RepID=A0ABP8IUT4_9BACT
MAFLMSVGASVAQAQTPINIASGTAVYRENFDVMGAAGTTYPNGWTGIRFAGSGTPNETLSPIVVLAGSQSGAVYNAGADGAADRALGSLASGSTAPAFGAVFSNQTGAAVTRVNIAARMEQWRTGSNNTVNEATVFEYSLNATSLNTGTWTAVTSLDLNEIAITSTTAAPLDGNLPTNSMPIAGTITLNWPNNTTMWIRWNDADNFGSDALLSIDNFAISTGNTALATRNNTLNTTLNLFPNPVARELNVSVGTEGRNAKYEVLSQLGQVVMTGSLSGTEQKINVANLQGGVYMLRLTTSEGSTTSRFTKN